MGYALKSCKTRALCQWDSKTLQNQAALRASNFELRCDGGFLILHHHQINAYTQYCTFILGTILIILLSAFRASSPELLRSRAAACELDAMLEVGDLRKRVSGFAAIGGVELDLAPSEITAIIGPNGVGKSTFFNLRTGPVRLDIGTVRFDGHDITGPRRTRSSTWASAAHSSAPQSYAS